MSGSAGKALLNRLHDRGVFVRRVRVLGEILARFFPESGTVLDIGCGDGAIAVEIMRHRPDLDISGVDVLLRPARHIRVTQYDGTRLPFEDNSLDYALVVDVLHHTEDPASVLAEAARVARRGVVLKDHLREGLFAGPVLRFMDWVGNYGHDVVLPYNYLDGPQWASAFAASGLELAERRERLALYPFPAGLVFDRRLHFVARLRPVSQG
jgi:SAM-dependent methyltransferase